LDFERKDGKGAKSQENRSICSRWHGFPNPPAGCRFGNRRHSRFRRPALPLAPPCLYPLTNQQGAATARLIASDGAGFQPLAGLRIGTWGVAPGWYENAPLALTGCQRRICAPPGDAAFLRSCVPAGVGVQSPHYERNASIHNDGV
jgi:hypothetical protein